MIIKRHLSRQVYLLTEPRWEKHESIDAKFGMFRISRVPCAVNESNKNPYYKIIRNRFERINRRAFESPCVQNCHKAIFRFFFVQTIIIIYCMITELGCRYGNHFCPLMLSHGRTK